jgi:hypothetical protein
MEHGNSVAGEEAERAVIATYQDSDGLCVLRESEGRPDESEGWLEQVTRR